MNSDRFQRWGIAAAIVIGVWLRFAGIGRLSLWFDEGYTAWVIHHRPAEIIRLIRADTAPPLYYLLLHGWTVLFGRSETGLRSFSAVCGIATIPLIAAIARRILVRPAATVAATWLFVLSFSQTGYSQEARGYELTSFLTAVMLHGVLRQLEKPAWKWLALIITAGAVGLYVNNFMSLYIVSVGAAALVLPAPMPLRKRLRDGLIAAGCMIVAYSPWIGSLGSQLHRVNQSFWIPTPTLEAVCEIVARTAGVAHYWSWDQYTHWLYYDTAHGIPRAAALLLVIAIASAVAFLRGNSRKSAIALAIAGLLPIVMAIAYSLCRQSIFLPAAFLPSTVVLPIFIAGALAWSRPSLGRAIVGFMILLTAVNLAAFEREQSKENWRGAADAVYNMPPVKSRLIVFVANEAQLPFDYYYPARPGELETGAPAGFFDLDPPRTQRRVLIENDLTGLLGQIASGKFDDIVMVTSHEGYSDPRGLTLKCLMDSMREEERVDLTDITIRRFSSH